MPVGQAGRAHAGEAAAQLGRAEAGGVQEHVVVDAAGSLRHPLRDRRGYHVPGGQVGHRVHAGHDPGAGRIDQDRALAAQRLGHQRGGPARARGGVEHGRVELHELHVGRGRPGPERERQPVPGGHRRVGRDLVELPEPAGGQQHGPRSYQPRPARRTRARAARRPRRSRSAAPAPRDAARAPVSAPGARCRPARARPPRRWRRRRRAAPGTRCARPPGRGPVSRRRRRRRRRRGGAASRPRPGRRQ